MRSGLSAARAGAHQQGKHRLVGNDILGQTALRHDTVDANVVSRILVLALGVDHRHGTAQHAERIDAVLWRKAGMCGPALKGEGLRYEPVASCRDARSGGSMDHDGRIHIVKDPFQNQLCLAAGRTDLTL